MSRSSRLHVVYRSHGGDNAKRRPDFYSKLLALASLVRAAGSMLEPPEILFVNDGPIPVDRLELMDGHGELVSVSGGSNRRSYRAAIALAADRPWPDDDVVWFAEDDYLYGVESLSQLHAAAAALPQADYFSMWGGMGLDTSSPRSRPTSRSLPRSQGDSGTIVVDGVQWYRGMSTTSTFGVRMRSLREDAALLRLLPFSGGSWDHTTCLTVQGRQPFTWRQVGDQLLPFGEHAPGTWPRSIVRGLTHVAVNLRSRRSPSRRRTLYSSDPETVFHMEYPTEACGRDWDAFAAQTRLWALDQGIPVDVARSRLGS